ncbi:MAG: hypothetical protein PHW04_11935 [Candidatus Wallbacteria bacterium]|nr:hypothetical protein [Candidatus Wallbacteria bacterium]
MDSGVAEFFGSMHRSFGNDLGPFITQCVTFILALVMGYFVFWCLATYLTYLKILKLDNNLRRCLEDRCGLSASERKWMEELVKNRGLKPCFRLLLYKTVLKRHMDERDLARRGIDPEILYKKIFRDDL